MKDKDTFVCFRSWYDSIRFMSDEEQLKMFHIIFQYGLDGTLPGDDCPPICKAVFTAAIVPQSSGASARYAASVENGKKGGRPRKGAAKQQDAENEPKEPKTHTGSELPVIEHIPGTDF